jgi:hypothetical protein
MEKATDRPAPEQPDAAEASPPRCRGPGVSKLSIDRTVILTTSAPAGALQGLRRDHRPGRAFKPEVTLTALPTRALDDPGRADGDGRSAGGPARRPAATRCGPNLHRLVLTLHFQGQMTCERIVAVLTAAGLSISKRQVVRLLTAKLDLFRAEEEAVFAAGLRASGFVILSDDAGQFNVGEPCALLGSRRAPRPQTRSRQRPAAQRH